MSSAGSTQYQPISTMDNAALERKTGGDDASLTESGLPATRSTQRLMAPSDSDSVEGSDRLQASIARTSLGRIGRTQWFTVAVLCFVNLINYMDRFTIAGVLTDIQDDFEIGDDDGGLLQTAFVISYMICAPLFGYLGDRYSRRYIMAVGVLLWSTTTLLGSFMNSFGWFITFRALVGIGEASYSTIAPTIISDLFVHDMRSKMLALFYFAIPVGSGFGYIVGSETARLANNWRWALRVTPFLGIAAVVFILFTKEPVRGESEGSHNLEHTTYAEDLKDLMKNRSFMLSTGGFTCVAFVTGALAWWGPKFIYLGLRMQAGNENLTLNDVSYKFGIIAMVAGLIGVPLGSVLAQRLRHRIANCDPYICAFGVLISAPMVYFSLVTPQTSDSLCFFFVFVAQVTLNLCWSIVADILLYVVIPTRRSTAEAFQILMSHALGDAGSPYFVGVVSEAIKKHLRTTAHNANNLIDRGFESLSLKIEEASLNATMANLNATVTSFNATSLEPAAHVSALLPEATLSIDDMLRVSEDTNRTRFEALQYALFSTCFIEVVGAIFFFITTAYIVSDKDRATQLTRDSIQRAVPNPTREEIDNMS